MNHKPLMAAALLSLSLLTASAANAETSTTSPLRPRGFGALEELRYRAEERRELMERASTTPLPGMMRERFDEFRANRIGTMIDMMKLRFQWSIDRLESIASRIETRIEKIEDETDTTLSAARASLDSALAHIEEAKDALADVDADDLFAGDTATSTDEKLTGIRNAFADVKTHVKAAWEDLREALAEMKAATADDATNQ